jgi:hypothetical protein
VVLIDHMKILIAAIVTSLLILGSCTKPKTVISPTVFSIHCADDYDNNLGGVTVNLYTDSTDWANGINIAYSSKTSDSGNVTFPNITPGVKYYFSCHDTANCWLNYGAYFLGNPLAANQTTAISLTLTGYGPLSITNTSADKTPYEIKINGKVWASSLAYGQTLKKVLPVQTYTIEAQQLGRFIGYKADIIYGVTVLQCQPVTQNIP